MCRRGLSLGVCVILAWTSLGCGASDRAELEKIKAELEKIKAEMEKAKADRAELEKIKDELKGLKSEQGQGGRPKQGQPPLTVDELAKHLVSLRGAYLEEAAITETEWGKMKSQLITKRPLSFTDLNKDLKTIKSLYERGCITETEWAALKLRLLETEPAKQ